MMKKTFLGFFIAFCMVNSLFAVVVTSIEQLDALAAANGGFSFSVFGDNNGYEAWQYNRPDGGTPDDKAKGMARLQPWVETHDKFCLGVGDHAIGTRKYWYKMNETNPFWQNNYYPSLGDNCNGTDYFYGVTGDQAVWGRGWVMFKALNNFFTRSNATEQIIFRQPGTNKVISSKSKAEPNTPAYYDDQLCDYYAKRKQGKFTFHIISINFPDPGWLAPVSKDFMMNKLYELAATKTAYDIIIVLAQKNNWLKIAQMDKGWMSREERDKVMAIADMTVCGDDHIYRRQNNFDADYVNYRTNALWMNSGQPCDTTGSGRGYLNCHVFDNPPRFTVQYILTDPSNRTLHVNAYQIGSQQQALPAECTKPYLKYVNGSFVSVDWNNFDVVNNAGLVQRIEAERYASNTGFVSQVTSDTGGGTNMSCSAAGATMTYPVTISPSSAFNILARVASSNTPIQFDLKNGTNVICSVDRTTTGGNQVWVTTTNTVYLPEGSMTLSLQAKSGFNVNWLEFQPIGNVAPVITSTPELGADVGSLYQYAMTASDLEGDALTFSSLTLPSWLSLDSSSGVLSGTPPVDQMGSHPVVLQVSDASNSSTQSFSIWVSSASNEVPVITSTPETGVIVSNGYSYTLSATDGDLHTLSYSVLTKPSWLGFDSVTRVLSGTPASSNVGSHAIGFAVTDGRVTVTQQFSLVVFPIQPANLVQNPSFELGTTNVSGWTTGGTATNVFVAAHGSRSLRIQTPVGSTTPTRQSIPVTAGTVYSYSVWINAAGITTSAVVFDTGIAGSGKVVVSNNTGWTKYSGSVTSATTSLSLRLSPLATNFGGVAYIDHIILTAGTLPVNAPVITSIPETNAAPQNLFSYRLLATDANNEPLTFTGVTVPSWLSFNTNSGVLSGTPTGADVGNHPVVLSVRNGSLSVTQSFTIAVTSIPLANRYAEWAAVEGVGAPNEDDDHDGRSNFYEYTLFGSPMNTNNLGIEPTAEKVANELEYKHWMRNDDSNLIYTVQMTTNLLFDGWTNAGIPAEIVGTNGPYHQLKYRIPMQTPGSYIRLKVTD